MKRLKIDYLYIPSNKQIYPKGTNKKIKISAFRKKLCGAQRPGHFEAIVDVIERFIKIIHPKKIYLGEKDMQQLKIIENFVKKKYTNVKIVGCKTIREKNGVAYSSRNFLLNHKEKKIAGIVYNLILNKKKSLINKKTPINGIRKKILKLGVSKIDYIRLLDVNRLANKNIKIKKIKIFIAYYLRATRLIDNI